MRRTLQAFTAAVALCLLSSQVAAIEEEEPYEWEEEYENGVLVLDEKNYDLAVAKYDNLLVMFYAPWCGHCERMMPGYEEAAEELALQERVFAKIDAEANPSVADRMTVRGFPTTFFYKDGKSFKPKVGRKKQMIVNWVMEHSVTNTKDLETCEKMRRQSRVEDGRLVAYFGPTAPATAGPLYKTQVQTSLDWDLAETWNFRHLDDEECAAELGVPYPSIALFRFFDSQPYVVDAADSSSSEALKKVLKIRDLPEILNFNEEYINTVMSEGNTSIVLFTNNVSRDRPKPYFQAYEETAMAMFGQELAEGQEQVIFVASGVSHGIQIRLANFVGVKEEDLPALYIITPEAKGAGNKYKFAGGPVSDLTAGQVRSFVDDFRSGSLPRHFKSDPVPEQVTPSSQVRTIVGKTWSQVMDPSKDVFVAYITPYCQKCKIMQEDAWIELASVTPDDLIVAVFDGDANEVEGVQRPQGYPSVMFYPKNNKEGINYKGALDLTSFKTWLGEHSSSYRFVPPTPKTEGVAKQQVTEEL